MNVVKLTPPPRPCHQKTFNTHSQRRKWVVFNPLPSYPMKPLFLESWKDSLANKGRGLHKKCAKHGQEMVLTFLPGKKTLSSHPTFIPKLGTLVWAYKATPLDYSQEIKVFEITLLGQYEALNSSPMRCNSCAIHISGRISSGIGCVCLLEAGSKQIKNIFKFPKKYVSKSFATFLSKSQD